MLRNNRRGRLTLCFLLALAFVIAFAFGAPGAAQPTRKEPKTVPGELLVGFAPHVTQAGSRVVAAGVSARERKRFARINAALLSVEPDKVERTLERLRRDPRVRFAEPNFVVQADAPPNDPHYGQLWGLRTIGAEAAWARTTGSSDVVAAVIDTGVDQSHPDLAANTWVNAGEDCSGCRSDRVDNDRNGYVDDWRGWDFVNGDNNPMDDHGHGTHVAGTVGAVGNNGVGVTGVNWRVRLMALKFLGADGSGTTADAVAAILYASANGASVLNNSWSGGDFSQALLDAIEVSDQRNALFVAAAGNDGSDNDLLPAYPSSYTTPNIVSVAATDSGDFPAFFTNYGRSSVDLAAPGVNVLSTWTGGSYQYSSGTSMAAPHVAGAAALAKALHPGASDLGLKALLLRTSHSAASLAGLTASGARLDAASATACAAEPKVWVDAPAGGFQSDVGDQVDVRVLAARCADAGGLTVSASLNGTAVALTARGDGLYTGRFTVSAGGRLELAATASAGEASDTHTVVGAATQVFPIVPGGPPVTVTTTAPGETAQLEFAGRAGQRVSLQLRDVSVSPSFVTMSSAGGAPLATTLVGTAGGFVDTRTLPVDGEYRILVDPQGDATGSMTLSLFDVPADATAPLAAGGATTLTTTVPGQNARGTFEGRAGQRVSVRLSNVTMSTANVSLVRVGGSSVGSGAVVGSAGAFLDARTLPQDGTYAVVVDPFGAYTGSATLTLYDVPPDATGTLVPGGPAAGVTTTAPGQNARLAFDGAAGQRVSARVSNVSFPSAYVSLVKPDGTTLGSKTLVGAAGAFLDVRSLPSAGRYELLVDPQGAGTGSASVTLYDVPPDATGATSPGGPPASVSAGTPGQNARVTFAGTAGQRVSVRVSGVTMSTAYVSLLHPNGSFVVRNVLVGAAGGFLDTEQLAENGDYTIVVDPQGAATGSATLTVYDVPADASGSLTVGGPPQAVAVTVPGQNARVTFAGSAGQRVSLVLSSVSIASSYVSVLRPDGSTQAAQTLVGPTGRTFTLDLTQSGAYTVVIDPRAAATGSMTLRATA